MTVIIIKGSTHHVNIKILNVYVPGRRASKYMQQKLIKPKGEKNKSTIMTGDFNAQLSITDGPNRQNNSAKKMSDTTPP